MTDQRWDLDRWFESLRPLEFGAVKALGAPDQRFYEVFPECFEPAEVIFHRLLHRPTTTQIRNMLRNSELADEWNWKKGVGQLSAQEVKALRHAWRAPYKSLAANSRLNRFPSRQLAEISYTRTGMPAGQWSEVVRTFDKDLLLVGTHGDDVAHELFPIPLGLVPRNDPWRAFALLYRDHGGFDGPENDWQFADGASLSGITAANAFRLLAASRFDEAILEREFDPRAFGGELAEGYEVFLRSVSDAA